MCTKHHNIFSLLSTKLKKCGQNVDKWHFFAIFFVDKVFANRLFYYYLPQHCLYFLPLPHAAKIDVLSILSILCVFPLFSTVCGQVTKIFSLLFVSIFIQNINLMSTKCAQILACVILSLFIFIITNYHSNGNSYLKRNLKMFRTIKYSIFLIFMKYSFYLTLFFFFSHSP